MPCRICSAGQRAFRGEIASCRTSPAWRATGLPTFSAVSKLSFITPQEPPWPEQRSITCEIGVGDQAQHLRRLLAHVLRPRVAGEVQGDAALERLQAGRQALALGDVDDVFGDVEGRLGQPLHRRDRRARSAAIRISASARRTAPARRRRSPCRSRARASALTLAGIARRRARGRRARAAACRSSAG